MTFYDANSGEREDRIIIGYDFTDHSVAGINLACNGQTAKVVIDLGANPIEIELVTGSVTAISHLIDALYEARALLEDHQVTHVTHVTDNESSTEEPLYIPGDWTEDQP